MSDLKWFDDPVFIDYEVTGIADEGGYKVYGITDANGTLQTGWGHEITPQVGDVMRVFNSVWGMAVRGKVLFRKDDQWSAVVDFYIGKHDYEVANGDPRVGPEGRAQYARRRAERGYA